MRTSDYCSGLYDHDGATVVKSRSEKVKTHRDHKCGYCGRMILSGSIACVVVELFQEGWHTRYHHINCGGG